MVKIKNEANKAKINEETKVEKKTKDEKKILVKFLMEKGYNHKAIARETKIPRTTVIRLAKEIENEKNGIFFKKKEKTKLPEKYFKKIVTLATNKKTSEMPGRVIADKLNEIFQKKKIKQNYLALVRFNLWALVRL